MTNEQLQEILQKLLKRLDIVTMAVLVVIGLTLAYLVKVREGATTIEAVSKPAPAPLINRFEGNEVLLRLDRYFPNEQRPLSEDENLRVVVQNDIFSVKALGEGGRQ